MHEATNRQMVSAPQRGPQSPSLAPASNEQFRNELTACLALVAPVGMTEEARREWLTVAWGTLGHLPADVLARGCKAARERCDHPSKIVPTIISATDAWMRSRREAARDTGAPRLPRPDYIKPAEAASILKEFGLR
jgi:hypothetical protein